MVNKHHRWYNDPMPWTVSKKGDKYLVKKKNSDKVVASSDTKKEATDTVKAKYMHAPEHEYREKMFKEMKG